MINKYTKTALSLSLITSVVLGTLALPVNASSHREAPFISQSPKVDGTDFYMFTSYEADRSNYVTMIANYVPLQDGYGGPNYFEMDPAADYEIKIDNDGDSLPDHIFTFNFTNTNKDAQFDGVSIPLVVSGPGISNVNDASANVRETYKIGLTSRINGRYMNRAAITEVGTGNAVFDKPLDNIGNKTIPNYAEYAAKHVYNVNIPGCATPAKVFVGQRKESFVVNLGEVFDLINLNPLGVETGARNSLEDKNVTSIAMEVPKVCLTNGSESVIGGWTAASVPRIRVLNENRNFDESSRVEGKMVQVSRLGMPLVNEVVIGLKDKDKFNKSKPKNDIAEFANYVVNPTLPKLVEALFSVPAPAFARTDLVAVFVTGLSGLNQPANVQPGEMLRLNTAIDPTPLASQDPLGVLNLTDLAGFPNGRRPVDDVVDISLRVAEGILCTQGVKDATAAAGVDTGCGANVAADVNGSAFTDGARSANVAVSTEAFPYLLTPLAGSPNVNAN